MTVTAASSADIPFIPVFDSPPDFPRDNKRGGILSPQPSVLPGNL